MPELAVKIKIAPSSSSTTISGMSHHFFSCRVNLKNSLRSAHIDFFQGRISNHCWQWQICAAQLRFLEQLPAALRILRIQRACKKYEVRLFCSRIERSCSSSG